MVLVDVLFLATGMGLGHSSSGVSGFGCAGDRRASDKNRIGNGGDGRRYVQIIEAAV
jgi:hypothetical protein